MSSHSLQYGVQSYRQLEALFPLFDDAIEATRAHNGSNDYSGLIGARFDATAYTDTEERCFTLRLQPDQLVLSAAEGDTLRPRGSVPTAFTSYPIVGGRMDMTATPPFRNEYILFHALRPIIFEPDEPRVYIGLSLDGLRQGVDVRKRNSLQRGEGLIEPYMLLSELARPSAMPASR